jgi:hypothetical protein
MRTKILEKIGEYVVLLDKDTFLREETADLHRKIASNAAKSGKIAQQLEQLLEQWVDGEEEEDENFQDDSPTVESALWDLGLTIEEEFDEAEPRRRKIDVERTKARIWAALFPTVRPD